MGLPVLSIIVFSPLVGALVIMALPEKRHTTIKVTAAATSFIRS